MKVVVNDNKINSAKPFPKLMKNTTTKAIWLMSSQSSGTTLVKADSLFKVGETSTNLFTERFVDFEGSITLSND